MSSRSISCGSLTAARRQQTFRYQKFDGRSHQPRIGGFERIRDRILIGAGQPENEGRAGLAFERKIGEYSLHRRLIAQETAENRTPSRMMYCQRKTKTHLPSACNGAVETCPLHHRQNGAYTFALRAQAFGISRMKLDLSGCIRAVPELVFQALKTQRIDAAVRAKPGQQKRR